MEKLLDIGASLTVYCGEESEKENLYGRVILTEDNKFEGVAENIFSNGTYFIFGNLESNKLDFIIGSDETEEVPKRVIVYFDRGVYRGSTYAKDIYNEIPFGECRTILKPADQTREVSGYEISIVKNSIKNQKENLGERSQELYELFKEEKNKVKKIGKK